VEAEGVSRTEHEKIWILDGEPPDPEIVEGEVASLLDGAVRGDAAEVVRCLADLVRDYTPSEHYRALFEQARKTAG
jgi:hypothetical protein